MSEKRGFSDLPFFETVQGILSHYTCPSRCPAICCKLADISLDEKDMERISKASNYSADKIESCIENGETCYKIHPPCPFLESDMCSIYDFRSTVCRIFPFNICNKHDVLLLFPCDMGARIFEDYAGYAGNILKHPIPAKTMDEFEESHCSFSMRLNEGLPVPMLVFKIESLSSFREYLESRD